jgi:hypothetical protein
MVTEALHNLYSSPSGRPEEGREMHTKSTSEKEA